MQDRIDFVKANFRNNISYIVCFRESACELFYAKASSDTIVEVYNQIIFTLYIPVLFLKDCELHMVYNKLLNYFVAI